MTTTALNVTAVVREYIADVACFTVLTKPVMWYMDYARTAMPCAVRGVQQYATTNVSRSVSDVSTSARCVTREICVALITNRVTNTDIVLKN